MKRVHQVQEVEIHEDGVRKMRRITLPTIVCLCGSTRFREAFETANFEETLAGNIVLTVGHADSIEITAEQKESLDSLHLAKIDLADEVLVLNVDRYVGDSTMSEIAYALWRHKPLRWLEEPLGSVESWIFNNRLTLGRLVAKHSGFVREGAEEETMTLDNDIKGLGKAGDKVPMSKLWDWSATKGFERGYHREGRPDEPVIDPRTASLRESITAPRCSVCGEPQFDTDSGMSCLNGHGGA